MIVIDIFIITRIIYLFFFFFEDNMHEMSNPNFWQN